jgi:hypothetical protein
MTWLSGSKVIPLDVDPLSFGTMSPGGPSEKKGEYDLMRERLTSHALGICCAA